MSKKQQFSSLYTDPETGKTISTNSMLKSFLACPNQARYKYYLRLKPKTLSKPLTRGKWMHSLLEAFYKGEDWKPIHRSLTHDFSLLFDEEKDALGDLPRECARLMRGYLWHYANHSWDIKGVEGVLEAELPDGTIFRGRYDLLVEDEFGLWIVDHKNFRNFPDLTLRQLDTQAPRYVWAARQNGLKVKGFIWNYLKTTGMTKPALLKDGTRLSRSKINTDYPTYLGALKEYGLDTKPYKDELARLRAVRFDWGAPQVSPFFYRNTLEYDNTRLERLIKSTYHTSIRMHDYRFDLVDTVERNVSRACSFMCSYNGLCQTELIGGNTDIILRKQFSQADPMDYYYDEVPARQETED